MGKLAATNCNLSNMFEQLKKLFPIADSLVPYASIDQILD